MLKQWTQRLWQDFALKPVIATEIEFYLHGVNDKLAPAEVIESIRRECKKSGLLLASVEQERGPDQYEIALQPSADLVQIAEDTERFKALIATAFPHAQTDFSAKPLSDKPGSGLHVHVHLEDADGRNVFFREEEEWSPSLLHAIGGLLFLMNPCMKFFAPSEQSYARFTRDSNAPTTISWGTNNRTVAIRLPTKPLHHKHIEHRVSGSDANVEQVITAILAGVYYGLQHKSNPGEPIYGDASHSQYALPKLAQSLEEAQQYNLESNIVAM